MSSFGDPIHRQGKNPFEKYYRIESLKPIEKNAPFKDPIHLSPKSEGFAIPILGYFLFLLQKALRLVSKKASQAAYNAFDRELKQHLLSLQTSFRMMTEEDRSQDSVFLSHLSLIWEKILEQSLKFTHMTPLAIQFKTLIRSLASYPENTEHTFGYYLSECAGQKWLPFPYIALIQNLHRLYRDKVPTNPLTKWMLMVDQMITLLHQD